MIEALNSVVSNASAIRIASDQIDVSRASSGSARSGGAPSSPSAPFISPYISVNYNYNEAVIQIRDSNTGDVVDQFPSEARLEQIRRQEIERQQLAISRAQAQQQSASSETQARSQVASSSSQAEQSVNSAAPISLQTQSFESAASVSTGASSQIASSALISASQTASAPTSSVSVSA